MKFLDRIDTKVNGIDDIIDQCLDLAKLVADERIDEAEHDADSNRDNIFINRARQNRDLAMTRWGNSKYYHAMKAFKAAYNWANKVASGGGGG